MPCKYNISVTEYWLAHHKIIVGTSVLAVYDEAGKLESAAHSLSWCKLLCSFHWRGFPETIIVLSNPQ